MASYLYPNNKNVYVMKFTCSSEEPVKVFYVNLLNIHYKHNHVVFNNLGDLITYLGDLPNKTFIYVYNLKFDYAFLFSYLKRNKINIIENEFIVGDDHNIMEVELNINGRLFYLRDASLLVSRDWLDFNVSGFNTDDKQERQLKLLALSIKRRLCFSTALTTSSAAKKELLKSLDLSPKEKRRLFPSLSYDTDQELRPFYRGGYCYLNPDYKNVSLVDDILIIDKNSMYGFVMSSLSSADLPYGVPLYFEGEPVLYDYKLFCVTVSFDSAVLRSGVPFVRDNSIFNTFSKDYQSYIDDNKFYFFTNYDLQLFLNHYKVKNLKYLYGYYFSHINKNLFDNYINKYYEMRLNEDDKELKNFAKMMLNAPSGKFGEKQDNKRFESFLNKKGVQEFKQIDCDNSKGFYLPMAIFITSYVRYYLISLINSLGKDFIYCDTDSIHLLNFNKHKNKFKFGNSLADWKIEGVYLACKYLKNKIYMTVDKNFKYDYTIAGLDASNLDIDLSEFKLGIEIDSYKMNYCVGGATNNKFKFRII